MRHTIRQVFRSGKFLTGFVILIAILLVVLVYPLIIPDAPLSIIAQGTFFEPGIYVNVYDSMDAPRFKLNLRDAARHPDAKKRRATALFATEYIEVLSFWRYLKLRTDLTIHDFFYALARLGGHQNRRSDHRPGWLILWRGWAKLQNMLDGYLLAQRKNVG